MDNHIIIVTEKGNIELDLFKDVEKTVSNFLKHVKSGFYNMLTFHRVTSFCIQTGQNLISNYKPKFIPHEITYHRFGQYTVGMADAGVGTAATEFFITKCECPSFNGRYIVFGRVVKGIDVVWKIKQGDVINIIGVGK